MIFIKLVEVILYIVMLPLSLLSSLLPSIPESVQNVFGTILEYINSAFSFILFFLTCGGNSILLLMYGFLVTLLSLRLSASIFLNILKKFIKVVDKD